MRYVGLGKTLFNSSLCTVENGASGPETEIYLSERFDRVKNSGKSPITLATFLHQEQGLVFAESSDVVEPQVKEKILDEKMPFFDYLKSKNLTSFSRHFNPAIVPIGHHMAHACAAVFRSPFQKALVFVMDGAGSSEAILKSIGQEKDLAPSGAADSYEHVSVYLFDNGELRPVRKKFMTFTRSGALSFGTSPGIFYETISKFIFNTQTDPGKVMGLAPFGKGHVVSDLLGLQKNLPWEKAFQGKGKKEWEAHPEQEYFRDLAATAQLTFEDFYLRELSSLRADFPEYQDLILTGGCALNCTANWKLQKSGLFREIYVAPNPGDESIGLGCAAWLWFRDERNWRPVPWERQNSFLGPLTGTPDDEKIPELFRDHTVQRCDRVEDEAAESIARNEVIAWFQGRSECGPRALGHRSILARPDRKDLKNYLNEKIKFRESFRPYGCTVLFEDAEKYFEVPGNFRNPFMSFAVPVRASMASLISQVTHVDNTSRMQTLEEEQDPQFHRLLLKVRKLTGHGIVLNTSLNVMGEPILETTEDAVRFFQGSEVDALFIGNYMIRKKNHV